MSDPMWRVRIDVWEVNHQWTYEASVYANDAPTAVAKAAIQSRIAWKDVQSVKVVLEN